MIIKFEENDIRLKLESWLGKEETDQVKKLPGDEVAKIARKLIIEWASGQEVGGVMEKAKQALTQLDVEAEEDTHRDWWQIKRDLIDVIESILVPVSEKQTAINWLTAILAVDLIGNKWRDIPEILGSLWMIGQVVSTKQVKIAIEDSIKKMVADLNRQNEEVKFLDEMIEGVNLAERYEYEAVGAVKCFYKRGDKHRFVPILAAFPPLSKEDTEKIGQSMTIGLPKGYGEFLLKTNGLRLGWSYFWWGARKRYNEVKHLEQNHSLINSRVDEQLISKIASTEVVIGSDKYQNIYVMDVTNDCVYGIIRPDGDELAEPTRRSFKSLGALLGWQMEMMEKEKEDY